MNPTDVPSTYDSPGKLVPIQLWTFQRNDPDRDGNEHWRVGSPGSWISQQGHRDNLNKTCDLLNDQEATIARLRAEMSEVTKELGSLREDLKSFSTFEQICNSGMLRNFKIDSESPFAQTILNLLQRTMELQISHLDSAQPPRTKEQSNENDTGKNGIPTPEADGRPETPDGPLLRLGKPV